MTPHAFLFSHRSELRPVSFFERSAAHFVLGQDSEVTSIEVRWPSGLAQMLNNVAGDRYLPVGEPVENAKRWETSEQLDWRYFLFNVSLVTLSCGNT
ncbi:MAG TPA: ASPIC/UnbV domain-containing protein [Acidobacteriaceae bacterium]|nr:ASPIC/UnbV domain-containing protein [Acidobacteriaceae bacterium]